MMKWWRARHQKNNTPAKNSSTEIAEAIVTPRGEKDVYGTLNLLTPSVIKAAKDEIQDGVSISLNWSITGTKFKGTGRKELAHTVKSLKSDGPFSACGFDDEIHFNTQVSSQWDSLCEIPTLQHWHQRGGVVGRGVLIDYKAYADTKGIKYSCFEYHSITIAVIEEIARLQKPTFRQGDIIIVRTGLTEALDGKSEEEQGALMMTGNAGCCGVEGTVEAAKWFWNHHFAAVAGDGMAFESINIADMRNQLVLHQYFLSLFGMPIGELWDLKALSKACEERQRWTFFLTSIPLNYPGSVGSPPHALAIF
ncbi:hypothetical protein EJ08DRAFT_667304 [Tothia fuscella]|uniref:Cyclase n=1 Tax=Tothia fuscella TaxID=1048955 RepID=A0A9P4P4T4_9PEZI|nr:hypothetical protein EJ08DRAFT_667304 [Tothia fuscella]